MFLTLCSLFCIHFNVRVRSLSCSFPFILFPFYLCISFTSMHSLTHSLACSLTHSLNQLYAQTQMRTKTVCLYRRQSFLFCFSVLFWSIPPTIFFLTWHRYTNANLPFYIANSNKQRRHANNDDSDNDSIKKWKHIQKIIVRVWFFSLLFFFLLFFRASLLCRTMKQTLLNYNHFKPKQRF